MQDGKATARVSVEPAVETQHIVAVDDDGLALGDTVSHELGAHDSVASSHSHCEVTWMCGGEKASRVGKDVDVKEDNVVGNVKRRDVGKRP